MIPVDPFLDKAIDEHFSKGKSKPRKTVEYCKALESRIEKLEKAQVYWHRKWLH